MARPSVPFPLAYAHLCIFARRLIDILHDVYLPSLDPDRGHDLIAALPARMKVTLLLIRFPRLVASVVLNGLEFSRSLCRACSVRMMNTWPGFHGHALPPSSHSLCPVRP